jgi:hypothetical protein
MSQKAPFNMDRHQINKDEEMKPFGRVSDGDNKQETIIRKFPKQIFIAMVVLILSSIVAFVIIPADKETRSMSQLLYDEAKGTVSGELSLLFDLGTRAKRLAALQGEVERILLQDTIKKEDSIFLEDAMHELGYFKNPIQKSHED